MENKSSAMTKEQAYKEIAKVAVAYRALENGAVSLMSKNDFDKFMEWLD